MEIITNSQFSIQNLKQPQKRKWNRLYESCCRFYFLIMFQLSAVTKHSHANFCQQQFCTNIKIDDRVSSFRIQIKKTDHKPKNILSAHCKIFCSFINTLRTLGIPPLDVLPPSLQGILVRAFLGGKIYHFKSKMFAQKPYTWML